MATNAFESVQKHFAKDPPKPVSTRAQNGILKNIERKPLGKENQNQSQGSVKSGRSDMSGEPSLYMTALENMLVCLMIYSLATVQIIFVLFICRENDFKLQWF